MISIIFLLSTAVLAQASPSNFNSWNHTRIKGGSDAKDGEFPYMVSIRNASNNEHLCGGSILNEQYILTAAHCFHEKQAKDVKVVVGTIKPDSEGTTHTVHQVNVHKGFKWSTLVDDIAILRLGENITMSKKVQPISISDMDIRTAAGEDLSFCGWGFLHFNDFDLPKYLQKIKMKSISLEDCQSVWKNDPRGKDGWSGRMCTQFPGREGLCKGDSGSPLVNEDGQQVGFLSFGPTCGIRKPDIFTYVKEYLPWINDNSQTWREWERTD